MATHQEINIFEILSNKIRRKIVHTLYEEVEMTYSELLASLGIDDGLLNFHLRKLRGLISTTDDGKYVLSGLGRSAYGLLITAEKSFGLTVPDAVAPHAQAYRLTGDILWRRMVAFLIDAAILLTVTAMFLDEHFLEAAFKVYTLQLTLFDFLWLNYHIYHSHAHLFFLGYFLFTLFEAYRGQTIGKIALGIRVVKLSGRKASLLDVAIRNLGKIFLLPLDVLLGLALCPRRGYLRFFDFYVKVRVERVIKPIPGEG